MKICPLGDVWGKQELPLFILGTPHISETNRARKLKFGMLAGICLYCGVVQKFNRYGESGEISIAHFYFGNPSISP